MTPDDPRHGTQNGYGNLKCRCDRCRKAHIDGQREYQRAWRRDRRKRGISVRGRPYTSDAWATKAEIEDF